MNPEKLTLTSIDFLNSYNELLKSNEDVERCIVDYLERMEATSFNAPAFPTGLPWLNCSSPLTFDADLSGKLSILDFFTYCCINCMHVLPDLHVLENRFTVEDGVAIVGVHSAKFGNEKVTANILSAILRYDITHPVVNDYEAMMWNEMSIRCWPTFAIISPTGKVLLYLVGEGHSDVLLKFCEIALKHYGSKELITKQSIPIELEKSKQTTKLLSFPGKISLGPDNDGFVISDSGNNRILLVSGDGIVKTKIGRKEKGYKDGSLSSSLFNSPQGLVAMNNTIYVADTENHLIRKIDLDTGNVETLCGTGSQGTDKEGGKNGKKQEISSPWDVLLGPAPGLSVAKTSAQTTVMYIAMAGIHQIWAYYINDDSFFKGGSNMMGTCVRVAGSGNEENRNNSYPHKASFAQPSSITLATVKDKQFIYLADSESSSVRSLDVTTGSVKGCAGAERDPMNLFAYGDVDGKGVDAKLQHPLAVAWNKHDGMLYVADSYNHKIKCIDPTTCVCSTLAGNGKAGCVDGPFTEACFNEPGGICISKDGLSLIVADTNNHAIRRLDLESKTVSQLYIIDKNSARGDQTDSASSSPRLKRIVGKNAKVINIDTVALDVTKPLPININIRLPENCSYTSGVDSRWCMCLEGIEEIEDMFQPNGGIIDKATSCIKLTANLTPPNSQSGTLEIQLLLYYCSPSNVCLMKAIVLKQPYTESKDGSTSLNISYTVDA